MMSIRQSILALPSTIRSRHIGVIVVCIVLSIPVFGTELKPVTAQVFQG